MPSSPATLWPSSLFQFTAACKNPFSPLVSFQGSRERRDFSCRQGLEGTPSLAHGARIVNLAWFGALSLAMIPSAQCPCWALQSQRSSARDVWAHGQQRQWKQEEQSGLGLCLSEVCPRISSTSFPWSDTSLLFCVCFLWHNRPGFLCCSKHTWLSENSAAWSSLCCKV